MATKTTLTPDVLRQLLCYEAETGKLFWKHRDATWFTLANEARNRRAQKIWNTINAGNEAFCTVRSDGYLCGSIFNVKHITHRVAWAIYYGSWPQHQIDHINRRRADNRIANLRDVTHSGNSKNYPLLKTNTSGIAGIYWDASRGKWCAEIVSDGVRHHLGRFEKKQDAVTARKAAEVRYGFHPNHGRPA